MSNIQLIASLIIYILSVVCALLLAITLKKSGRFPARTLLLIHFSLFLLFFIFYLVAGNNSFTQTAFLLFFCSGILLAGMVRQKNMSALLRFYPVIFLLSIAAFVLSPSRTIRFITFSWDQELHDKWNIDKNYFLEEERLMLAEADSLVTYKVTRQFGIFHKTLARNISFGNRLDSIHVKTFRENEGVDLRGYYIRAADAYETCDSVDLSVPFETSKNTIIQKRK